MFTMEQIMTEFNEMKALINEKSGGRRFNANELDNFFNLVDEKLLFECISLEEEDKKDTSIHFLIGRVSVSENDDETFEFFPTLTIQKRDSDGGLVTEEDYYPEEISAEEDINNCFAPFLKRLKHHESQEWLQY